MTKVVYNNLTELLLNVIKVRPGMYLGTNEISKLPNLILGYEFSNSISELTPDFYFGEKGFLNWYREKYKPSRCSHWEQYFVMQAGGDEVKALELYFVRLEEYYSWYKLNKS
jgi:hypothetical protein